MLCVKFVEICQMVLENKLKMGKSYRRIDRHLPVSDKWWSRDLTCSSSELRHTKLYKMNVKVICIDGIINTMLTFKLFCKDFMDILWLDALIKLQYFPDTCISGHIVRKRILPTVTPISWDNKPKHACITDSDIHLMRE